MIDTNVIISTALFPRGRAALAFYKTLASPYEPIIADYVFFELEKVFRIKFPSKLHVLRDFLKVLRESCTIVETPKEELYAEKLLRDPKDRPLLRAALSSSVDIFLTGDKDFLESSIKIPKILSVADFLAL